MNAPTISVVIPVRDAAGILPACLASIHELDYPKESIELLVVDNGSTDDSTRIAHRMGALVLQESRPGPYGARNLGASRARGAVLAFTDADCQVDRHWARAIASAMVELDAVCGLSLGAAGGPVAGLVQERYERNLRHRAGAVPLLPVFDTRNAAVSRTVFARVGGFDARLDDLADDLFGVGVVEAGGRLGFRESMQVTHVHPETLAGVRARQVRHGKNIPLVRTYYPNAATRHFPGIDRHARMYRDTWCASVARGVVRAAAATAGAILAAKLTLAIRMRLHPFERMLFEYFCRAGTLQGIAMATPPAPRDGSRSPSEPRSK